MPTHHGPPWGHLMNLPRQPRVVAELRKLARVMVRVTLEESATLEAAAASLGVTIRSLHRLTESHRTILGAAYAALVERSVIAGQKKRWLTLEPR